MSGAVDAEARQRVAEELHTACTEVGFFYCSGHGVDPGLMQRVLHEAEAFFALEQAEKDQVWIGKSSSFRGYQRVQENVTNGKGDFHEAIDLYSESLQALRSDEPGTPSNHGANQWPEQPPQFREYYESYIQKMQGVGAQVMRCMAVGLGLREDYFEPFYDDGFWGVRVIHYPAAAPGASQADLGCGVHCDYGCLTMINADDTSGCLQAMTTDGTWMTIEPIPGTFICNIGDMLARWTNGMYRSTPHRVYRPKGRSRISVPFFFEPNYLASIAPLPECCAATGRPPRFEPIMYGDHLMSKTSTNFSLRKK